MESPNDIKVQSVVVNGSVVHLDHPVSPEVLNAAVAIAPFLRIEAPPLPTPEKRTSKRGIVRKDDDMIPWPADVPNAHPSVVQSVRRAGYLPAEMEAVENAVTKRKATIGRIIERSGVGKHNARMLLEMLRADGKITFEEEGNSVLVRRAVN